MNSPPTTPAAMSADTAPAAMPGEDDVARAICNATGEFDWNEENESTRSQFRKEAVAAISLFAPVLDQIGHEARLECFQRQFLLVQLSAHRGAPRRRGRRG